MVITVSKVINWWHELVVLHQPSGCVCVVVLPLHPFFSNCISHVHLCLLIRFHSDFLVLNYDRKDLTSAGTVSLHVCTQTLWAPKIRFKAVTFQPRGALRVRPRPWSQRADILAFHVQQHFIMFLHLFPTSKRLNAFISTFLPAFLWYFCTIFRSPHF